MATKIGAPHKRVVFSLLISHGLVSGVTLMKPVAELRRRTKRRRRRRNTSAHPSVYNSDSQISVHGSGGTSYKNYHSDQ